MPRSNAPAFKKKVKPGFSSVHAGHVNVQEGRKDERERQASEADAFLNDKESAFCKIVPARASFVNTRGGDR